MGISSEKHSYPLQISVNYTEVMHVLQAICNVDQLKGTISKALAVSSANVRA